MHPSYLSRPWAWHTLGSSGRKVCFPYWGCPLAIGKWQEENHWIIKAYKATRPEAKSQYCPPQTLFWLLIHFLGGFFCQMSCVFIKHMFAVFSTCNLFCVHRCIMFWSGVSTNIVAVRASEQAFTNRDTYLYFLEITQTGIIHNLQCTMQLLTT